MCRSREVRERADLRVVLLGTAPLSVCRSASAWMGSGGAAVKGAAFWDGCPTEGGL